MDTTFSTSSRTRRLVGPRFTASAVALALLVALSGNAAARPLERDDSFAEGPLITPKLEQPVGPSLHIALKLRTTAGRAALVY